MKRKVVGTLFSFLTMKISRYCSYEEATKSQTAERKGIDNQPNTEQTENMKYVAKNVFDKVREAMCCPLYVSSFFRSPALNKAIGGSKTSEHMEGCAIDIDHPTLNKKIFHYIRENLNFNQLIWEFGDEESPAWVHVSLRKDGRNKKQILVAYKDKGRTKYKNY